MMRNAFSITHAFCLLAQSPPGLGFFSVPMPTWLMHLTASLFLHQDQVFLHHQERKLLHATPRPYAFGRFLSAGQRGGDRNGADTGDRGKSSGDGSVSTRTEAAATPAPGFHGLHNDYKSYAAAHFTPNEHDIGITKLRRWIARRAQGGPVWGSAALALGLPPTLPSEQLFDVYHAHVESCTVCLSALRRTKRYRDLSLGVVAITTLFFHPTVNPYAGAVAAVFGLSALAAHKLMKLFYTFEFSHQDND
jgi:hypothetical protein